MKPLKLAFSIILMLNLSGCWSKVELNELTFVYGMYIDAGEKPGTVEVSVSAPLPNRLMSGTQAGSGTGDGKSYHMVSKTAESIPDAIVLIQKDLSRALELSHIKIVVIGKELARQGIEEIMEWFKREPVFPIGTYIMAAPGKAKEIQHLEPIFEQLPDQVLMNFSVQNLLFDTSIKDCMIADSANMGYAMNYLSFGQSPETTEQGKPMHWAGLQGLMLFQQGKMKCTLNLEKSRSLAWAAGNLAGHIKFPLYSVSWDDDGKGKASALFLSNKSKKTVKMTNEGPVFHIKLKGSASIHYFKDSYGRSAETLAPMIRQKLQEKVAAEVLESLEATQKAGADVLQLGMLLEWNYPEEWKKLRERWEDYYASKVQIIVTADFTIADFGSEK